MKKPLYICPVHVIAAPRTGSTFIWQCLTCFITCNANRPEVQELGQSATMYKYLAHLGAAGGGTGNAPVHGHKEDWVDLNEGWFEAKWKTPTGIDECDMWCDIIITERNHIDSYLSCLRIGADDNETFLESVNTEKTLLSEIDFFIDQLQYMEYLKQEYKGRVLVLEYEKFVDDYDYIFDKFESFLVRDTVPWKLILNDDMKSVIKTKTARNINIDVQTKLEEDFSNSRLLHKRHIWSKKENYSKDILTDKNYNLLLEKFAHEKITPKRSELRYH